MTKRWEPISGERWVEPYQGGLAIETAEGIELVDRDNNVWILHLTNGERICMEVDDPAEYYAMCQGNESMEIIQYFETLPNRSELQTIADREDRTVWLVRCVDVARVEPSSWTKEQSS